MSETENIRLRYSTRKDSKFWSMYSPVDASVYMGLQEKERAMIRWINSCGIAPVENKTVLEIGCGSGSNLLNFLSLGFNPENLVGNELLKDRADNARHRLPVATKILLGDASELNIESGSFDVVFQSTVFTSILDIHFQQTLADKMWWLAKAGGGCFGMTLFTTTPKIPM
jgi:ubiquinone/menaquinone biosynthesis C-methylase UbiE